MLVEYGFRKHAKKGKTYDAICDGYKWASSLTGLF